jgi:hypothetical protein
MASVRKFLAPFDIHEVCAATVIGGMGRLELGTYSLVMVI